MTANIISKAIEKWLIWLDSSEQEKEFQDKALIMHHLFLSHFSVNNISNRYLLTNTNQNTQSFELLLYFTTIIDFQIYYLFDFKPQYVRKRKPP